MDLSHYRGAIELLAPPKHHLARYYNDPVAFVHDCFKWPEGKQPTFYQDAILARMVESGRLAVRGPHGLGKTTTESWCVLWFSLTRDDAGEDWKIATTASVWRQLEKYLWPEIHKWATLLDWDKVGRPAFKRNELLDLALKLPHGSAFAVASDQPSGIEGAHADQILYIFDEAKAIPAETFDAAEGAFSGAGASTSNEAYALACSTPGEPSGRFYEIHTHKAGLEDWHTHHVTLADAILAGRVAKDWAEQRALQWGTNSAVYHNRVLGEFHASDELAVIPLQWVEEAVERWKNWDGALPAFSTVGVDVSRSDNGDRTVMALRYGQVLHELRDQPVADTMVTADLVYGLLREPGNDADAVVDVVGVGAGVVDRLRQLGCAVRAFGAAERTDLVDRSGELGFANKRAAAWWTMREYLDPANGYGICLPDNDRLIGDLTAPRWKIMAGGKILVESKDDIRKRIGRSTDDGDAAVQAFWWEPPVEDELYEYDEPVSISAY